MSNRVFYIDEDGSVERENHAGCKAREDVSYVLDKMGFTRLPLVFSQDARENGSALIKVKSHFIARSSLQSILSCAQAGDAVVVQFPLNNHSIFQKNVFKSLVDRGVSLVLIIHDLDSIRYEFESSISVLGKLRMNIEELSLLKVATKIIVHNERMMEKLSKDHSIDKSKLIPLRIFDYLLPEDTRYSNTPKADSSIVIAGNMQKEKAGYVYKLPESVPFNIYGPNYDAQNKSNIAYMGQFSPEVLPSQLQGSFGLVWDGCSIDTCAGPYGEYLRLNNPHKTSLYLAAGLPVIIWDEAALAPFIEKEQVGITVSSLDSLPQALETLSDSDYAQIKNNAVALSKKLRTGHYSKRAIQSALCI